ncbi:MAG TPA: hypothetical protein VKB08_10285, partial [Bradyrhizobium sp.]|nr:hypothetical protein [Bradyrhizobium sp.]
PQGAISLNQSHTGGKTRIHTAPFFRERRHRFPVRIIKPQLQRVQTRIRKAAETDGLSVSVCLKTRRLTNVWTPFLFEDQAARRCS